MNVDYDKQKKTRCKENNYLSTDVGKVFRMFIYLKSIAHKSCLLNSEMLMSLSFKLYYIFLNSKYLKKTFQKVSYTITCCLSKPFHEIEISIFVISISKGTIYIKRTLSEYTKS